MAVDRVCDVLRSLIASHHHHHHHFIHLFGTRKQKIPFSSRAYTRLNPTLFMWNPSSLVDKTWSKHNHPTSQPARLINSECLLPNKHTHSLTRLLTNPRHQQQQHTYFALLNKNHIFFELSFVNELILFKSIWSHVTAIRCCLPACLCFCCFMEKPKWNCQTRPD